MKKMSDTRNKIQFFKEPVDTQPSNDTDEIMEMYLKHLDNILETDEEYQTIVNTNYVRKGEKYDDRSREASIRSTDERN